MSDTPVRLTDEQMRPFGLDEPTLLNRIAAISARADALQAAVDELCASEQALDAVHLTEMEERMALTPRRLADALTRRSNAWSAAMALRTKP